MPEPDNESPGVLLRTVPPRHRCKRHRCKRRPYFLDHGPGTLWKCDTCRQLWKRVRYLPSGWRRAYDDVI